ncbi:MAG TPA: 6-bladed beta-propeller [Terriglobales bacterium]|jgi:DNA-binding beta-propeller fold protein YncE|nr:6-bladed beta-propeller [Terriglobales bacterium]
MTISSRPQFRTWITWFLVAALALLLVPASHAGKKDKKKKEEAPAPAKKEGIDRSKIDTSKLVWPLPPDLPRIKFVSEHFGEPQKPVEAKPQKKKQGWMDRMAGVQQRESGDPVEPSHVLGQPYGVAVDSKGRVYVGDTFVAAIFIFNTETKEVTFLRNGHEAAFRNIIGIAIDDTDRLFVADAGMHQVSVFSPQLKLESTFGADDLKRPSGIAIDSENRFAYVVDTGNETVFVYDADNFKLLRKLGGPAKKLNDDDPATFAKPTNVALDKDGNVYISDTLNNRVQIFDADGNFISMFGKAGDGPGTFQRPKGVAVDTDGHIWVVDASQCNVQIYDKEGHLLAFFGYGGGLPGQFGLPAGIAIDKNNRVIVSDQIKGRIQVFRYITDAENTTAKAELEKKKAAEAPASATGKADPEPKTAEVKQ